MKFLFAVSAKDNIFYVLCLKFSLFATTCKKNFINRNLHVSPNPCFQGRLLEPTFPITLPATIEWYDYPLAIIWPLPGSNWHLGSEVALYYTYLYERAQ